LKRTEEIPHTANEEFVNKIAYLVTKKIYPRLPETTWNNFNLTSPNTSMLENPITTPPLHYDNIQRKNDENDIYGKKLIGSMHSKEFKRKVSI
jgi:hypothetical protein